jgi:hypothetical protein
VHCYACYALYDCHDCFALHFLFDTTYFQGLGPYHLASRPQFTSVASGLSDYGHNSTLTGFSSRPFIPLPTQPSASIPGVAFQIPTKLVPFGGNNESEQCIYVHHVIHGEHPPPSLPLGQNLRQCITTANAWPLPFLAEELWSLVLV